MIGAKTSRLLATFLQALFIKTGKLVEVRKGVEPVDIVLLDQTHNPVAVMFAEIKAAPLVTLPLAITSQLFTEEDGETAVNHRATDHATLYRSQLSLMLPIGDKWELISFGSKQNAGVVSCASVLQ